MEDMFKDLKAACELNSEYEKIGIETINSRKMYNHIDGIKVLKQHIKEVDHELVMREYNKTTWIFNINGKEINVPLKDVENYKIFRYDYIKTFNCPAISLTKKEWIGVLNALSKSKAEVIEEEKTERYRDMYYARR